MLIRKKLDRIFFPFFGRRRHISDLMDKEKASRITGCVTKFDKYKGYGFIRPNDGGPEIFVHYTDICHDRSLSLTSEEKKKLSWNSNINLRISKEDFDFENEHVGRKEEIKREFKYLIPGERVKFSVIYDEQNHSSKAICVEYLD
ncbi:cold-shock protein [Plasmodium gonderi]|uniref:Cold-shock protein n=1 Tax=Plasmodium gonderi TaxID=77519 RepID=A0A1Y1JF64_PLAGO|nr:cold-shock protein [Plasmodium gonderi]GAW79083.1 cold-shock protein [Plasmodium gonderi]